MKKDLRINTQRGYPIYLKCQTSNMNPQDVKNVIVCSHGFSSSKNNRLFSDLMEETPKYEIVVVTFDFQGHGDSIENVQNFTVQNSVEDLKSVEKYVKESFPNAKITLLANSFGAYIALLKLKKDKEQGVEPIEKTVILKSPAINMPGILKDVLLKEPFDDFRENGEARVGKEGIILPYSFYEDLTRETVTNFQPTIPTYVYHGENDEVSLVTDAEELSINNPNIILRKIKDEGHSFSPEANRQIIQDIIKKSIISDYGNIKKIILPESCSDLTSDEKEIAMVRKLQIMMAPFFSRDFDFFYQQYNYNLKRKIYNTDVKLEDKKEQYSIVCKTLVNLTCEILAENEIDAKPIACDDDEFSHIDLELTTKSGKKFIINLLTDLELTQMGCKPTRFATESYLNERYSKNKQNYNSLSEEEVKKIDEKLGFLVYGMYLDDAIKRMEIEFDQYPEIMTSDQNKAIVALDEDTYAIEEKQCDTSNKVILAPEEKAKMKIEFLMQYFNYKGNINSQIELIRYYKFLTDKLLSKEEKKHVKFLNSLCRKSKGECEELKPIFDESYNNSDDKWRFLIISVNGNYYAISCKENSFVSLTKSQIDELTANGMLTIFQKKSSILGEYIRNFGKNVRLLKHPVVQEQIFRFEPVIETERKKTPNSDINQICQKIYSENFGFNSDSSKFEVKNESGAWTQYYFEGDTLISESNDQKIQYIYSEKEEKFIPSILKKSNALEEVEQ